MSKHAKDRRPYLPPVNRIELSENNLRSRWILLIALVLVGILSIGFGIHYALDVQPGWNEIQEICDEPNYSKEFHFMYDFSRTGGNATAVNKEISLLYSEAMEEAYRIFSKDAQIEGFSNLYYLNRHPNETVTVNETLYQALALLDEYNNRFIFLAPVYVEYNRVFISDSDAEAKLYDPQFDSDAAEYIAQLMGYISEESAVDLELLADNQVKLHISEDYLSFAEEYGIEEFLDLGWLRNAFVADYVAERLTEKGYTSGYLASFDGYTRSLAEAGELDVNIFHRMGTDIYAPAKMTYAAPMSIVTMRDYPVSELDRWTFHVYEDGTITSSFISPENGNCGTSLSDLTCYAESIGCAELLVKMLAVLFAPNFNETVLLDLADEGVHSIWCEDQLLYHTQQQPRLTILENAQGIRYKTSQIS